VSAELIAVLGVGVALAGLNWRMSSVLRREMGTLRANTRNDLAGLREEVRVGIAAVRSEIGGLREEMRTEIGRPSRGDADRDE